MNREKSRINQDHGISGEGSDKSGDRLRFDCSGRRSFD
ncbi:hypothetical Protein YC6258_00863 [Gynuella sunshinyii YC6258]|uniref:Uncharacterized protein n=1 Tax=Gynuella sunshinyii YC6258 TaxID=1445510 RepID=A0A0C5VHS6_9GAMM|nr:hypothetical Protein YC6258_00863 [Gynuella sunshinyii YC6258]